MIKFAIIGTNFISDLFVEAGNQHENFEAVAVYSRNFSTGKAFSDKHNLKHIYTDLEKMAEEKLFDAVYIASPNALHFEHAKIFLERNIPVLLEKPMVSNAKEAKELFDLANKKNTLVMQALRTVFEPRLQAVFKNLDKLSKIRKIVADFSQYSSRYNNYKKGIIENAFNPDLSNGAVMDIGIYLIAPVVLLFGKPEKISASGNVLPGSIDGQGAVLLSYPDKQASLTFSKITNGYQPSEIQGENGVMIIHRNTLEKDTIYIKYNDGRKETIDFVQEKHPMYYEIAEFISLVENKKISSDILKQESVIQSFEVIDEYRKQINLSFPAD